MAPEPRDVISHLRRRRVAIPIATVVLLAVLFFGGQQLVARAEESARGDSLYQLKNSIEDVRLNVAASAQERARLHLAFAQRRVEEVAALVARGRYVAVPETVAGYQGHVQAVVDIITAHAGEDREGAERLAAEARAVLGSHIELYAKTYEQSPSELQPVVEHGARIASTSLEVLAGLVDGDATPEQERVALPTVPRPTFLPTATRTPTATPTPTRRPTKSPTRRPTEEPSPTEGAPRQDSAGQELLSPATATRGASTVATPTEGADAVPATPPSGLPAPTSTPAPAEPTPAPPPTTAPPTATMVPPTPPPAEPTPTAVPQATEAPTATALPPTAAPPPPTETPIPPSTTPVLSTATAVLPSATALPANTPSETPLTIIQSPTTPTASTLPPTATAQAATPVASATTSSQLTLP